MLELNHIYKYYNPGTVHEICLFEDFGMKIDRGDFVSVIGSNGSGKTSLLNLICGSILPEAGQICMNGKEITKEKEYRRNQKIGRVYQNPAFGTCPGMTILENMAIADHKGKRYGFARGINKKQISYYRELLSSLRLGLEEKLETKVGDKSGSIVRRTKTGNGSFDGYDDTGGSSDSR